MSASGSASDYHGDTAVRLSPLQLSRKSGGSVVIETPVYLAPMSGVTDLPFRRLAAEMGAPITVSEMIASNEALRQTEGTAKRMMRSALERLSIVQLAGHDPAAMAETARFAEGEGADIIDINFGCPAKKVTSKYCGSALMKEPTTAKAIVEAVVDAVNAPVTVKMRTGWDADHRNAPEIARIAEECGAQLVTVHGRTRDQKYSGTADWGFVASVRDAVSVPLLINGDITSSKTARMALKKSQADGVMIGRATQGKPWLVGAVAASLKGETPPAAPKGAVLAEIVAGHYEAMLSHHGSHRGVRMARKHLSWYAAGLPGAVAFRNAVMSEENPANVFKAIAELGQGNVAPVPVSDGHGYLEKAA